MSTPPAPHRPPPSGYPNVRPPLFELITAPVGVILGIVAGVSWVLWGGVQLGEMFDGLSSLG